MGVERHFHADAAVPDLAGDIGNGGRDAAILGPRKTLQAQARVLSRANAAQRCRRIEVSHDPQISGRHDDSEFVAFVDDRSDPQGRHFAQLSVDWSAYPAAIDLLLQPLNGYAGRRLFAT